MAMIHVNRGATSLGAFPEEQVREGLRAGRFIPSDLGWREGMASWKPLSQFPEFAADIAAAPSGPPPQTVTATVPSVAAGSTAESLPARTGLPWEHRQERGLFSAFIETLQMVLTKPDIAFRTMKVEGGLSEPIVYALIGGCVGGIVSFLFSFGLRSVGIFANRHDAFTALVGTGIGSVAFIILLPVCILLALFIGAAIIHLCLMIVG